MVKVLRASFVILLLGLVQCTLSQPLYGESCDSASTCANGGDSSQVRCVRGNCCTAFATDYCTSCDDSGACTSTVFGGFLHMHEPGEWFLYIFLFVILPIFVVVYVIPTLVIEIIRAFGFCIALGIAFLMIPVYIANALRGAPSEEKTPEQVYVWEAIKDDFASIFAKSSNDEESQSVNEQTVVAKFTQLKGKLQDFQAQQHWSDNIRAVLSHVGNPRFHALVSFALLVWYLHMVNSNWIKCAMGEYGLFEPFQMLRVDVEGAQGRTFCSDFFRGEFVILPWVTIFLCAPRMIGWLLWNIVTPRLPKMEDNTPDEIVNACIYYRAYQNTFKYGYWHTKPAMFVIKNGSALHLWALLEGGVPVAQYVDRCLYTVARYQNEPGTKESYVFGIDQSFHCFCKERIHMNPVKIDENYHHAKRYAGERNKDTGPPRFWWLGGKYLEKERLEMMHLLEAYAPEFQPNWTPRGIVCSYRNALHFAQDRKKKSWQEFLSQRGWTADNKPTMALQLGCWTNTDTQTLFYRGPMEMYTPGGKEPTNTPAAE